MLKRTYQIIVFPFALCLFLILMIANIPVWLITGRSYLDRIMDLLDDLTLHLMTDNNTTHTNHHKL